MTEDKIYDIVNDLINTHETKNPFRIAKELGAIILTVPLIRVNGFYQRYESQDIIYINQDLTYEEKILVCAHELGHMILHNDKNFIFLETNKLVKNRFEVEANTFAILLLRDVLNLRSELPLVDWYPDNSTLISRALSQF